MICSASFQLDCESQNELKSPATNFRKKTESNINILLPRYGCISIKTKKLQDPFLARNINNSDGLWGWNSFLDTNPKSRLQEWCQPPAPLDTARRCRNPAVPRCPQTQQNIHSWCAQQVRSHARALSLLPVAPTTSRRASRHKEAHCGLRLPTALTGMVGVLKQQLANNFCKGPDTTPLGC